MPKSVTKRKATKLNAKEKLDLALKDFDHKDHKFIRTLHTQRKDRTATARERKIICDLNDEERGLNQTDLVRWALSHLNLEVAQPTISRWISNKGSHEGGSNPNRKRNSQVKHEEMEERLIEWFNKYQHCANMTGDLIKRKAEKIRDDLDIPIASMKVSNGWLDSFKKRHGIRQYQRFGESGEVDMAYVESERPKIRKILDQYELCDIYNMDETGFFYQQEVRISNWKC